MRFPSLFRVPKYQQFEIKPRYYDPVKEEIKERTERIKQEMEGKERGEHEPTRISFRRKTKSAPMTSMLQLPDCGSFRHVGFGWLQFGSEVFYYIAVDNLARVFTFCIDLKPLKRSER